MPGTILNALHEFVYVINAHKNSEEEEKEEGLLYPFKPSNRLGTARR